MRIARMIYPVNVLGAGNRIGIWTAGCPHECKGCSNPELWDINSAENISVKIIFDTVAKIRKIHSNDIIHDQADRNDLPVFQVKVFYVI